MGENQWGEMTFAVFKDLCFSQEPGEMEYNELIRGAQKTDIQLKRNKFHLRNQMEGENIQECLVSLKSFPSADYQEPTRNPTDFLGKKTLDLRECQADHMVGDMPKRSVNRHTVLRSRKKRLWLKNAPLPNWHMLEERAALQAEDNTVPLADDLCGSKVLLI